MVSLRSSPQSAGAVLSPWYVRWLSELCSHPAIWAGADRARLDTSVLSHSRWVGRPPRLDWCHLSSPSSSNHHAARNHMPTEQQASAAAAPRA